MNFKSMQRVLALGGVATLLAGCATYSVAGHFENGGQAFLGKVSVGLDTGKLEVVSLDGSLTCTGTTHVVQQPLMTTIGAQGRAEATCSDGRTFKLDFIQSSELGGSGQGIDSLGNIVQVFFNTSPVVVKTRLDQALLDDLVR